jgi:hypothetical protein
VIQAFNTVFHIDDSVLQKMQMLTLFSAKQNHQLAPSINPCRWPFRAKENNNWSLVK